MRLAAYTRVSSKEQKLSGLGIEAQKESIAAAAKRLGHEIVSWHSDEGLSGTKPIAKRPGLMAAIEAAKQADGLIVAKADRLSRKLLILEQLLSGPFNPKRAAAKELVIADTPIDLKTASGRMMLRQLTLMAEFEVEMGAERSAAAAAARAKKCGVSKTGASGAKLGLAWAADESDPEGKRKVIVQNEAEQEILRLVGQLRSDGLSIRQIVAELNARQIPTKKAGGRWHTTTVARMIAG